MKDHPTIISFTPDVERWSWASPDKFTLTPERGFVWLQKAAIWVLRRLRCNVVEKGSATVARTIREDRLLDNVLQQMVTIKKQGLEPDMIIMGVAEEGQIILDCGPYEYESTYCGLIHMGREQWPALHGVRVRVVPWMKGTVVVPKVK